MEDYTKARIKVANLIGINVQELTYILYKIKIDNLYTKFEIPKKNGNLRTIYTPNNKLKYAQRQLGKHLYKTHLDYISDRQIDQSISHGFEKNKSIITNARIHKNKKYLLNIDILDFFSSFNFGRVQGYFHKSKEFNFSKEVSTILAQLVCYKGSLPQGAPTSPIISNLIFNIVDIRILRLTKKYKLNYTRYADDLSFSTNNRIFEKKYISFLEELTNLLENSGFKINKEKTRLQYNSSRQEVTGLTTNKKINANRTFINKTRAMANSLYQTNNFQINGEDGTINQLEGRFSFINQLDWENNRLEYKLTGKIKNSFKGLNCREKQYQYFLFYKYFFNPSKPTIVTEGKTDITHIKAALMKYYYKYPKLITKSTDGKYYFNVYFLNRTKRLKFFLRISEDGADTMKNIWGWYTGKNNCENLYKYIKNKQKINFSEKNPVILLFDNEKKSDKPLRNFLHTTKIPLDDNEISKKIVENLFLHTIPLPDGLQECEIEDLYKKELLNVTIDNKIFNRSDKKDSNEYFGKQVFSIHIKKHYTEIDFDNFLPLLDSINKLC